MKAKHIEFLVEELSMEAFLQTLLPRLLPGNCKFQVHSSQGKPALLRELKNRLCAYRRWLPPNCRIVVILDRDNDDCRKLKKRVNDMAIESGLRIRSQTDDNPCWQLVNRIVIEELEAWYFGDWEAVRRAYPKVPKNIPKQAKYRRPDAISGGTWEAFERILKKSGYFKTGLRKIVAAKAIAKHMDPTRNKSYSFVKFYDAIIEATG